MTTRPIVNFDHHSPEFARDPAGVFREMREKCPVAWSEHYGGFWIPTRHSDISTVSRDDSTFSSDRLDEPDLTAITIPRFPSKRNVPIEMDPPEFFEYRRLLNPLMSPQIVETQHRPLLEDLSNYCVDQVIEAGTCDLVLDLASPVPALFTLIWLGMSIDEWKRVAEINHAIVAYPHDSAEFAAAVVGMQWQAALISETISIKRAKRGPDLISYFIDQEVDHGDGMSDDRISEIVKLIIAGGVDTTTSLTGQALMWLENKPEIRGLLCSDTKALELATEEFLRFFCPVTALARTVVTETELGGQQLRPGDRIMLPWYAANRDPEIFPEPDSIILDRFPNRHTAFGLGIHRCVGSNLARVSFRSLLTTIMRRIPDYQIDRSQSVFYPSIGMDSGWSNLPATFTAGLKARSTDELPTLGSFR